MVTGSANDGIYVIHSDRYGFFLDKLAKLSRRAERIIGRPLSAQIVDSVERKVGEDAYLQPLFATFYHVRLDAEPVKVEGYSFLATIDHMNDAGNIIRAMPGITAEIPESYRTAKAFCHHCNSHRTRRNTYLLQSEKDGSIVQIGKNCLADFIGRDAEDLARRAEFMSSFNSLGDSEDDFDGAYPMRDHRTTDTLTYLGHVAVMIRINGWMSRGAARAKDDGTESTSDLAYTNMYPPKNPKTGKRERTERVEDADKALAKAALDWARSLGEKTSRSDYEHNVHVIASEHFIEFKSTGIAASIVSAYLRAEERLKVTQKVFADVTASAHIGKVKERITFGKVRVLTSYSGVTGSGFPVNRYTFVTAEGNVLEWSASTSQKLVQNQEVVLIGTVASHGEYKTVKRTRITRCKVKTIAA